MLSSKFLVKGSLCLVSVSVRARDTKLYSFTHKSYSKYYAINLGSLYLFLLFYPKYNTHCVAAKTSRMCIQYMYLMSLKLAVYHNFVFTNGTVPTIY